MATEVKGNLTITIGGTVVLGPAEIDRIEIGQQYVTFYHKNGSITSINRFLVNLTVTPS